jgi:hypothetical protein
MNYHVIEARHVRAHVVWLRFRDGTFGEIDLAPFLHGPVMAPLEDVAFFRQFGIHAEFHTLVWPNGTDFAPEFLHDNRSRPNQRWSRPALNTQTCDECGAAAAQRQCVSPTLRPLLFPV